MNQLKSKITQALTDRELSNTLIVGMGTIIGAFFSYLLQFGLGKLLSISDFGVFTALISLSYLIAVPSSVLGTPLVKIVAELYASAQMKKLTSLFWHVTGVSMLFGVFIFSAVFLASETISVNLNIEDTSAIVIFGLSLGVGFITIPITSYLNGLLRYRALAFYTSLSSFTRFVIPTLFVLLGFRVLGVFAGITVVALLGFITGFLLLKKNLAHKEPVNYSEYYKRMMLFSVPVLLFNFLISYHNNVDLILVKKFFDPETAGYYAGTVTLGKILLFGAGAVTIVMFPKITALFVNKQNHKPIFLKFLLIQLAVSGAGLLAFVLFPSFISNLFFGDKFLHSVQYLGLFAFFISLYVILNFMAFYLLAVEKSKVFLCILPGVVLQTVLINMYHGDIYQIIYANISGVLLSLLLTALYVFI